MSDDPAGIGAALAALQASVEANILPGLAANEAGVTVLADAVAQVVGVVTLIAARTLALETQAAERLAAELRTALHAPD